jgi:hypothetical protein
MSVLRSYFFCFLAIDNDIMRKMCTLITSKGTDIDENIANQNHATRTRTLKLGYLNLSILYLFHGDSCYSGGWWGSLYKLSGALSSVEPYPMSVTPLVLSCVEFHTKYYLRILYYLRVLLTVPYHIETIDFLIREKIFKHQYRESQYNVALFLIS